MLIRNVSCMQDIQQSQSASVPDQSVASRGLKRSDVVAILVIGEIFALLLPQIFRANSLVLPGLVMKPLPVVMPLVALFFLWGSTVLGRKRPALFQLGKYAAVGFFNTAVNFAVINQLSIKTGVTKGLGAGLITGVGFTVAVVNSYFWNKYWTFSKNGARGVKGGEFIQFVIVSLVGLVLSGGFVTLVTQFVKPAFGLNARQWLNFANVLAIFISLAWNFTGYKFIVFRERKVS